MIAHPGNGDTQPVPPSDAVTAPWWAATRDRVLMLQHCGCGHVEHPPRALCVGCGRVGTASLRPSAGVGTVDTWTVVHRAPTAHFAPPYVIARVLLTEGPMLLTNLEGRDSTDWRCGDRVTVGWRALPDGRHLPIFTPEERSDDL